MLHGDVLDDAYDDRERYLELACQAMVDIGYSRSWKKNQVLHWSGETPSAVLVIQQGRLRVRRFDSSGNEQILSWLDVGKIGSLAPVMANKKMHFDVVADCACKVRHIPRPELLKLMRARPDVAIAISNILSERLIFVSDLYMDQMSESLAERLWSRLQRMAGRMNSVKSQKVREIAITQHDLAKLVGASRYRVGLELQNLAGKGLIEIERGRIRLLRHSSLAH